jgi:hypothetical protein
LARKRSSGGPGPGPGSGFRRQVLYIHGFDPRGPATYHALFREQAARAAALEGRGLEVSDRRREAGIASWSVRADGVETDYRFLRWDDLVRARWNKGEVQLLGELAAWTSKWGRLGFYRLAKRHARALWLAMLSTPVVVGLFLLSAVVVVASAGFIAGAAAEAAGLPFWAGAVAALLTLLLAPTLWRRVEEKLNLCWLSRCFTYMRRRAEEPSPDLAARDRAFAEAIGAALADSRNDEVLVVGHSLGALHAVSALARALEADPTTGRDGRLSFLTLGQPVAIFTVLPEVGAFRDDLKAVAAARQIPWLDVTSPSDPASACSLAPLRDVGDDPERVMQRSPRFHVYLTPENFRAIRRDPINFHFQYLRAPDLAGGFDYFAVITSARRLMDQAWVKAAAR